MSSKSVSQECCLIVSSKSVRTDCQISVSCQGVPQLSIAFLLSPSTNVPAFGFVGFILFLCQEEMRQVIEEQRRKPLVMPMLATCLAHWLGLSPPQHRWWQIHTYTYICIQMKWHCIHVFVYHICIYLLSYCLLFYAIITSRLHIPLLWLGVSSNLLSDSQDSRAQDAARKAVWHFWFLSSLTSVLKDLVFEQEWIKYCGWGIERLPWQKIHKVHILLDLTRNIWTLRTNIYIIHHLPC